MYVIEIKVTGINVRGEKERKLKEKLEKEFIELYSDAVDVINPLLEKWNNRFTESYGEIENEDDLSVYNHYMAVKTNSILKMYDGSYKGFKLRADRTTCEIKGLYAYRGTTAIVKAEVKEVE